MGSRGGGGGLLVGGWGGGLGVIGGVTCGVGVGGGFSHAYKTTTCKEEITFPSSTFFLTPSLSPIPTPSSLQPSLSLSPLLLPQANTVIFFFIKILINDHSITSPK